MEFGTRRVLVVLLVVSCLMALSSCNGRTGSAGRGTPSMSAKAGTAHSGNQELAPGVPVAGTLPDITRLANLVGPAVVNISTVRTVSSDEAVRDFFQYHMEPGSPFYDFFKQLEPFLYEQPSRKQSSLGSGFVIDPSGKVLTNAHVVMAAERIVVTLQGGAKEDQNYEGKLIGYDEESDIALVQIDAGRPLASLELADSEALQVGEWVVAIGNPYGLDHTVTMGIVSGKGRSLGTGGPYDDYIQTDASINPGNSGGPLVNLRGQVVGMNTAIISTGQGIGFAIPSNAVKRSIAGIARNVGVTDHGASLGVRIQDVDMAIAQALGLESPTGVIITEVVKGGAANRAGLTTGDVILTFNGVTVRDGETLERLLSRHKPGEMAEIAVLHRGKGYKVRLKLDKSSS